MSDWIIKHQVPDEWGINWTSGIPLHISCSTSEWSRLRPTRAGWCYGAPGVARSLWLVGTVLKDDKLRQVAIEAIEAVLQRPITIRDIDSPTLCHGISGLLAICLRFAHETNSPTIYQHIPLLVQQILNTFDSASPLGFRDVESKSNSTDDPGLLTGASGVVLTLLAAATSTEPNWDKAFLIS